MSDRLIDPDQLGGVKEVAELLMVNRTTVSNWSAKAHRIGFPDPVTTLAAGPIWDVQEVLVWYAGYEPAKGGRPQDAARGPHGRYSTDGG